MWKISKSLPLLPKDMTKKLAKIVRFGQFGPKIPKNLYSAWGGVKMSSPPKFVIFAQNSTKIDRIS